jgi:hypothetical protein
VRNGEVGTKRLRQSRDRGRLELSALEGQETSGEEPGCGQSSQGTGSRKGRAEGSEL